MPQVVVSDGMDVNDALRQFRSACNRDGILKDYKRSLVYEKPGDRRRRKKKESERRRNRALARKRRD